MQSFTAYTIALIVVVLVLLLTIVALILLETKYPEDKELTIFPNLRQSLETDI